MIKESSRVQTGVKFRCYPTKQQASVLLQWIGAQRFIYNAKVSEDRYFRRFARHSLNHTGEYAPVDQQYAQFKTELTPWMKSVPSQVLRNGAVKWKQAYSRYFQKFAGRPTIQSKHGKQSAWLTNELFSFVPVVDKETGEVLSHQLIIGTKKNNLGMLEFKAHKDFRIPASIHISIHAGRWTVSFNYDTQEQEPDVKDVTAWLQQFTHNELKRKTLGLDGGVVIPLAASNGLIFRLSDVQQKRIEKCEAKKAKWQRKLARRTKGSSNYRKAKHKVARYSRYAADVRLDLAHKASHTLVNLPDIWLFAFEALNLKNMTKRAKGKGRKAKSGLNKALLGSAIGLTKQLTTYKAKRKGKLVVEVPAHYSSQECSACGHTHKDNRKTQSEFVCQSCGYESNADLNASKVIAQRGVNLVLNNEIKIKAVKRCKITKSKVGQELSEPSQDNIKTQTPVESMSDMDLLTQTMQRSVKQETPSSACNHAS